MICPVCKTECDNKPICPECAFEQVTFEQVGWIELENWLETVVKPYRENYLKTRTADFSIEDGVLVKYTGKAPVVYVPEGVTAIGVEAFCENGITTEVFLPPTVKEIHKYAFSCCKSITCIHLPGSLESIAFGAFECCDKLSIHLPNSVSYLEGGFCLGAVSITVDGDNPRYSVQDGFLVDKKNAVLLHCWSKENVLHVPDGVKHIGVFAFPEIDLPHRVLVLPEGVECINGDIGGRFDRIAIPSTLRYIEEGALKKVRKFLIKSDNSYFEIRQFCVIEKATNSLIAPRDRMTRKCTVPEGVVTITESAFSGCSKLRYVVLPESVSSVGYGAFEFCNSLEHIFCDFEDNSKKWNDHWNMCCNASVYWKGDWFYEPVPVK